MACCIVGALLTWAVLVMSSFVRYRILGQERPRDPAAWHLETPSEGIHAPCEN